ncbi:MAG: HNH endonuclease family protein [Methanobacterium sp.]
MRIHVDKQQSVYDELWSPMEETLDSNLPEFIRHYLMHEGADIKQNDIYYYLKEKVENSNTIEYLTDLFKFSSYYKKLINPNLEGNNQIKKYLDRLNKIEVTTAYPLLLNLYNKLDKHIISESDFVKMLQIIENYLIRLFVCGRATNQLNKVFPVVISQLDKKYQDDYVEGLKAILQTKGYPRDIEFKKRIMDSKLYGAGNRNIKTKLILESIEEHFGHKEPVAFGELTIEHIMPQKFSDWWKSYYGEDWDSNQELYVHTIGNLTLTAYNQELSNSDYYTKQKFYAESHIELNEYFSTIDEWHPEDIERRSQKLAAKMLEIWPYFGSEDLETEIDDVTGKTPQSLYILGQNISVKSWRDVLVNTLDTIADIEPEKYEIIIREYAKFLGIGNNKFRQARPLKNGTLIEVNNSANRVQKFCNQVMETIDLSSEELKIKTN